MESAAVNAMLVRKYNQPTPRYTSYPTVPHWNEKINLSSWEPDFQKQFADANPTTGISLYLHLPFCESLCTYCGCNKKITTNHSVEEAYIAALQKEWTLYRKLMKQTPVIRELHLGGGTPTFFSPQNLQRLLQSMLKTCIIHPQHDFSIEGHPNNTTTGHLKTLYNLGFRRISFGVQDNDPQVQRIINRIQPFEQVKQVTKAARDIGFTSVNFDLIYGLPLQTAESIKRTMEQTISLRPDRIAFYSYAHVPWTSRAQRLFDESHLPSPEEKIGLYLKGKELLLEAGYVDLGMDHFALPTDSLYKAWAAGKLHRNFMGYTTQPSSLLLGLGVSSISDTGTAYVQNTKTLHDYYAALDEGKLPVQKGFFLSEEDQVFRRYILDIACNGQTRFATQHYRLLEEVVFPKLPPLEKDGLIQWNTAGLKLTHQGFHFMRNVCSAFDLYMQTKDSRQLFSKAI